MAKPRSRLEWKSPSLESFSRYYPQPTELQGQTRRSDSSLKYFLIAPLLCLIIHLLWFLLPSWYSMIAPSRLQLVPQGESMWWIQRTHVWKVRAQMGEPVGRSGTVTNATARWVMMGSTVRKVSCRCFELLVMSLHRSDGFCLFVYRVYVCVKINRNILKLPNVY